LIKVTNNDKVTSQAHRSQENEQQNGWVYTETWQRWCGHDMALVMKLENQFVEKKCD